MKKSVTSLAANGGFSLIGSYMLEDGSDGGMVSDSALTNGNGGSAGQVDGEKRGWD